MSNKMTPEIRFKGFTQDWEQRKLGDVTDYIKGFAFKSKDYKKNGVRIIRVSDLTRDKIKHSNNDIFVSIELAEINKKYKINKNEIIITTVGSKAEMKESAVGRPIIVNESGQYLLNQNLVKISALQGYDDYFIYSQLLQPIYTDYIALIERGNANQANIAIKDLWNHQFSAPKETEQRQIGTFFKQLDDTIALHQDKLGKLKQLKKGYMQLMFPQKGKKIPRLRFAHFSQEWEQRKLGELAQFNPKSVLPDLFEYVDLESVVGTELLTYRNEKKINAPSRAQRLAKKGDIFYQTVRPYQRNNYLFDLSYENYVFSTGYAQLRPYGDSYFLLSRLQENMFVSKVLDRCTGTSYPAINSNDLAQIEVAVPPTLEEQVKIGFLFRGIDDTIALQNKKISALQKTKKLYLQKMFT